MYLKYYHLARSQGKVLEPTAYLLLQISPEVSTGRYPRMGLVQLPDENFLAAVVKNLKLLHEQLEAEIPVQVVDAAGDLTQTVDAVVEITQAFTR